MTDTLPSSQALGDPDEQKIFLKPDGTSWQIFVEAGGITGGFKLRRCLKKAGAVVCSDPRQSHVILVDSSTNEGRLFIRDWGTDENKVVLEYSWVNRCISEGRVLDESHQWGGFLTHDDGLPIVKEETDDIPKSPLPTPRVTPEEALTRGRAKQVERNAGDDVSAISTTEVPQATTVQFQVPTNGMQPLSSVVSSSRRYPESQHVSAPIPPAHYPLVQPMTQEAPLLNPGYSMDLRAFVDFLSQQSDPRIGAQYAPLALATAMSGGTWPWVPQNGHANPPQMMNNAQGHQLDPSSLPNGFAPNISQSMQPTDLQFQDILPSSTLLASSHHKFSVGSPSSFESQTSKGKKRSRAGSSGYPPSSAESSSAPHRTSVSRQPSAQTGTLFASDTGAELSFFVQVDLKDRQPVLNAIKKNGGLLSKDHATADYAILSSRSTTFKDLHRSTHAAGRPAVNASFVHDCVRQNTLLDPAPYLFPSPASPNKKRKRQVLSDEKSEDTASVNNSRKRDIQVQRKIIKEENSPVSKLKVKEEGSSPVLKMITLDNDRSMLRSPSPPSEHSHARSTAGGVRYSQQEREYALRYAEVLLERDHQMTIGAMAGNLYRKVPTHSHASWRSFLLRTIRDDVELIRKRKSIAYRKARRVDRGGQKPVKTEQRECYSLDGGSFTPDPSSTPASDREGARKQDLETMSRFFATRPEEDEEDDAGVWALLTNQATCQSASSWEEFYTEHHEEVNERFKELTNAMPEDNSTGLGSCV